MPPTEVQTAHKPVRPLLIFDGDCGFCRMWIARWKQYTGDAVDYLPSQDPQIAAAYPEIPADWYRTGVVLVEPDGRTWKSAEAVVRTLAVPGGRGRLWRGLYERLPGFGAVAELLYRIIARHRHGAAGLTRLLWFGRAQLPSLSLTRWIFLRGLGAIYLIAFASLLVQIAGLVGPRGVLPAMEYFEAAKRHVGWGGFWQLPSLFWWVDATDFALKATCVAGMVGSLLLMLGIAQLPVLAFLWALYLSLCVAGQTFLQFQWDSLLLEIGLLACLLAPLSLLPRRAGKEGEPSKLIVWLLRWLTFRLMFQSGIVKLLSGDTAWRDLTALTYHYETQPLPTPLAWFAHHAPLWFHKAGTLGMYGIEIGLAFLIFLPRGLRIIAAAGFLALQLGIMLTGNYGYFNLLSALLCVVLLDDFVWPASWGGKRLWNSRELSTLKLGTGACGIPGMAPPREAGAIAAAGAGAEVKRRNLPKVILCPVSGVLLAATVPLSIAQLAGERVPTSLLRPAEALQGFRSTNSYGLFAVMTRTRPEITIEGSADGETWLPYVFQYKTGPLDKVPGFVPWHMPRLDWQMWFAALGHVRQNPWLINLQQRLLEGEPKVTGLLEQNPFEQAPPRAVRARVQLYKFTTPAERKATGHWWKAEIEPEEYSPALTLREGKLVLWE